MAAGSSPLPRRHTAVDVRIGVTQSPKELDVELPDGTDPDALKADIAKALGDDAVLWLTDRKGRQVGIPAQKVAYVEIGSPEEGRRIGFGG
jgi:hypothetical protein